MWDQGIGRTILWYCILVNVVLFLSLWSSMRTYTTQHTELAKLKETVVTDE
jgi:hypothetical protein